MTSRAGRGARGRVLRWLVLVVALVASSWSSPWSGATRAAHGGAATRAARGGPRPAVLGHRAPKGVAELLAVSCGSPDRCWAVGSGNPVPRSPSGNPSVIVGTTDGGATWAVQPDPLPTPSTLSSISCPDARHCMAVGYLAGAQLAGTAVTTSDGGRRWHTVTAPAGATELVGVGCRGAGRCLVLATDGSALWSATTLDFGSSWQRAGTLPAGFAGAGGVSCPDTATCLTAGYVPTGPGHGGGAIAVTTDGGASWQPAAVPTGTGLLHGVACTDDRTCVAVGTSSTTTSGIAPDKGTVVTSSGGLATFGVARAPSTIGDVFGVSCHRPASCAAVGIAWTSASPPAPIAGVVTTLDGGSAWRTPRSRYVPSGLAGVDCPTATSCIAVGGDVIARLTLPTPVPVR